MKLTCLQQDIPPSNIPPKSLHQRTFIFHQCHTIEQSQHSPRNELCIVCSCEIDEGFGYPGYGESSHKCTGHSSGKVEVVVVLVQGGGDVLEDEAVRGYVMDGLDVEGFFDFGVGCCEEVEDNQDGDEGVEKNIW